MFASSYESNIGQVDYSSESKSGQIAKMATYTIFPLAAFNLQLPIIGDIFGKVFGGMFKKATKMESCMKWWTYENISSIGPSSIIPIDIEFLLKRAPIQYRFAYDIIKRDINRYVDLSVSGRTRRMKDIFVNLAHEANQQMDLFKVQCAAQHRDETNAPPELINQVAQVWDSLREEARNREYNETFDKLEQAIERLAKPMVQIQERGKIYSQSIKSGKVEISPTKLTFRYTPSGMPLTTIGSL